MNISGISASSGGKKNRWDLVLLFVGAGVVASFQVGKAPPMLPSIRDELGMSLVLAGWVLSTFNVLGLAVGSLAGAVSDALGHRLVLFSGLVLQAAGSIIGAFSPVASILLTTRLFEGLGFLMIASSAPVLIFKVTRPSDVRFSLAVWSCFLPAGASIIMLLAPMFNSFSGWRGLWLANGAVLVLFAVFFMKKTDGMSMPEVKTSLNLKRFIGDFAGTVTSAGPLLLSFIFAAYTLQWLTVMGFLPTLLIDDFGIGKGSASIFTAVMVAVNIPGNLAGGWLMQKGIGRGKLICTAILIMGLNSFVIYSSGLHFWIRYGGCLAFSGFGGLLPASILSGAPVHAPCSDQVGTTNGLIMQGGQLGQLVGPPVLAVLVSHTGTWQSAPFMLFAAALTGAGLSLILSMKEKKMESDVTGL